MSDIDPAVAALRDKSLLLLDDDSVLRNRLGRALESRGFTVTLVESVAQASEAVRAAPPAFAVLDMRLEDGSGLKVVEVLRAARPTACIVMLTGYGNIATAVAAVKAGAVDYLAKPADADDVVKALLAAHAGEAQEFGDVGALVGGRCTGRARERLREWWCRDRPGWRRAHLRRPGGRRCRTRLPVRPREQRSRRGIGRRAGAGWRRSGRQRWRMTAGRG